MEKLFDEEELKGLEAEIEAAVDRLFVEKKQEWKATPNIEEPPENVFMKKEEPPLRSLDRLESQLLSLEWEVSKENINKSLQEIQELKNSFNEDPEVSSVLDRMAKLLNHMLKNEERIEPSLIKILLDSKETLKLLMRKEKGEIEVYKKLAYAGIEARFSWVEETFKSKNRSQDTPIEIPPRIDSIGKQIEEMLSKMASFSEKLDEILQKINEHLSAHEKEGRPHLDVLPEEKSSTLKVTVLKIGENLIGVESDKVFKLFKVPESLLNRLVQLSKIRIRGFEVKMIPLEKILPIEDKHLSGEKQILMVRDDGEFKGLIIDRVLNKLSIPFGRLEGSSEEESLLGRFQWIYQNHPEEIPVLDLSKC